MNGACTECSAAEARSHQGGTSAVTGRGSLVPRLGGWGAVGAGAGGVQLRAGSTAALSSAAAATR
jgi:hypothetical protein